jgi:predicted  nucleic acid-binding Zn-ribbon protein
MALRDGNRKNAKVFEEERERLDKWIHDVEVTSEKELQDTKGRIRDLQRQAAKATDAVERLSIQKKIQHLERLKRKLRQEIFDVQDQAEAKRDGLIQGLHRQMEQKTSVQTIFEIRWAVI